MTVVEREVVEAPAVVPVTTREVLHRAADLLEEFGWCQGQWADCGEGDVGCNNRVFVSGQGRPTSFCLVGATTQAAWDLGVFPRDEFGPASTLPIGDLHSPVEWNDKPGRTKAEVVAKLRAAADAA